jgi:hypothetical protein
MGPAMKRALVLGAIGGLVNAKIAGPFVGVATFAIAVLVGRLRDLQLAARASREKKRQEEDRERNARETAQLLTTYREKHPLEDHRLCEPGIGAHELGTRGSRKPLRDESDPFRSHYELQQPFFPVHLPFRRQAQRDELHVERVTSAPPERSTRVVSGHLAKPGAKGKRMPERHTRRGSI